MATIEHDDFSAGIYRGRKAPPGSVFDAVNALVNGEGLLFRRGGSAYWSASNAGQNLTRLHALYYPGLAAARVTAAGGGHFYAFNGTTPVDLGSFATPGRPANVNGISVFPIAPGRMLFYGGSLNTASYTTGTVSTTAGSSTVTGSGTSWLANVDAGTLMQHQGSGRIQVVRSVETNTSLTLTAPAPTTNVASSSFKFWPTYDTINGFFDLPAIGATSYVAAAGSGTPRLIATIGNRAYITVSVADPALSLNFNNVTNATTYQEVPSNADIVGAEGVGDNALLFTTAGVYRISNLSLDPVDDFGNPQQQVTQLSKDMLLWGDLGVAAWAGSVIVPAFDDLYLLNVDGTAKPISGERFRGDEGIRSLYRSYVSAGYAPGQAGVHRGHYWLTVVNGTTLVDVLVCRLDRGFAWTRWSGHAAGLAYTALRSGSSAPKLLGTASQRVTDLTTTLDATGNASEADGTTHTFTKISNDYDLGPGIRPDTAEKVRYVYETTGGTPTFTVSSAVGPEGASFTAATLKRGGGASDGTDYSAWRVGRKAERIRFKFETSSALTSLILRRIEVTIRQAGQT